MDQSAVAALLSGRSGSTFYQQLDIWVKSANMGKALKAVKVTTGMLCHTWLCKTLTCIVFCVAADWVKAGQSHQTSAVHIPFPFSYIPTVGACLPSSAKYTFQDATSSWRATFERCLHVILGVRPLFQTLWPPAEVELGGASQADTKRVQREKASTKTESLSSSE